MPASSRLPAVMTEASTLSPMATTAVSKSDALICSNAITSVMSACTVGICEDQRFTSSPSLSTASTSWPIMSSVVATELPKRPKPTTRTLLVLLAMMLCTFRNSVFMCDCRQLQVYEAVSSANHNLLGGVADGLEIVWTRNRVGDGERSETPDEHGGGENV